LLNVALKTAGSVIVAPTVVVQPLTSVIVKIYVPAVNPVCEGVITYGAVPPDALITTLPLEPAAQLTLTWLATTALTAAGSLINALTVVEHPVASVTVKV
jgi:hypothetical protein